MMKKTVFAAVMILATVSLFAETKIDVAYFDGSWDEAIDQTKDEFLEKKTSWGFSIHKSISVQQSSVVFGDTPYEQWVFEQVCRRAGFKMDDILPLRSPDHTATRIVLQKNGYTLWVVLFETTGIYAAANH